jgi:hypothetical protein
MAGVKVKVKTKINNDKELGDIFNQIIGAGKVNMTICGPKYVDIMVYLRKIVQIVDIFTNKSIFFSKLPSHQHAVDEFNEFIGSINDTLAAAEIDIKPYAANYDLAPDNVREEFSTKYNALKSCDEIASIVKLCDNLIPYKKFIADATSLKYQFILGLPGVEFKPFPWSEFNLKQALIELDLSTDKETRSTSS